MLNIRSRGLLQKHFDRPIPELDTLRATLRGKYKDCI